MRVLVFGATGMVGQGVLRECLSDPTITEVLSVGRLRSDLEHPKLEQIIRPDLSDLTYIADRLVDFDACFYCLGVSSVGMEEADYRRITYDLTLTVAKTLTGLGTFIYVSGQGTDSSESGRVMWARVKGQTENALLAMEFQSYMFRPGIIQPVNGARSKTKLYQRIYSITGPLLSLLRKAFPGQITTTALIGQAMINVAKRGANKQILTNADITKAALSN